MEAIIRKATTKDADALFRLVSAFATSYEPDRAAFDRMLPAIEGRGDGSLLLAEADDKVIGYVLALDQPTFFANGPIAEVLELFVTPNARHSGVGARLLGEVTNAARERGCTEVTAPTRRAGAFYQKAGFECSAEFYKRPL